MLQAFDFKMEAALQAAPPPTQALTGADDGSLPLLLLTNGSDDDSGSSIQKLAAKIEVRLCTLLSPLVMCCCPVR